MNLSDYIKSKENVKPNQDIIERWQSRIVPTKLHLAGEAGAVQYLSVWGKTAKAPKCIMFARLAEQNGFADMAMGFWKRAYELEVGLPINPDDLKNIKAVANRLGQAQIEMHVELPEFPEGMQPGRMAPMQPVDARAEREYYAKSNQYWGQPKRNGEKLIIFATSAECFYQSRKMKVIAPPSIEFHDALKDLAKRIGPFILEGELYWLDKAGNEHQTSASCVKANINLGFGEAWATMRFSAFSCPWRKDAGHMPSEMMNYGQMVVVGEMIMDWLNQALPDVFVVMPTATNEEQKFKLIKTQEEQGREGEIWFDPNLSYTPGARTNDRFVRTKYLTEPIVYTISEVHQSTAEGHYISGFEVCTLHNGKSLGNIGTGYTREEQKEILDAHNADPGNVRVIIVSRGFTVHGKLREGRFEGFAPSDWDGIIAYDTEDLPGYPATPL